MLRDYLKPLAALPRERGFRESGRIRVGPSSLRAFPPRENLVRVGRAYFGFWLSSEGSHQPTRALDWWIESRLERIDRAGLRAKLLKKRREYIPTIRAFEERQLGFRASTSPGIYRLTFEIQNADGVTIDRYEEHYRAVKARFDLRLNTSFTTLSVGETGYIRIDNLGTIPVGYGHGYRIWNSQGEEQPVEDIFTNALLGLAPGYAGRCTPFNAAKWLSPGRYRIGGEAIRPDSRAFSSVFKWIEIVP